MVMMRVRLNNTPTVLVGAASAILLHLLFACSCSAQTQATPLLYGVNYGLRTGPDWAPWENRCKGYQQVLEELRQLQTAKITQNVRIYSLTDCNDGDIMLQATQELGMGLWLGLWVGPNSSVFDVERQKLLELMSQFDFSNVLGIHVSSESIYRGDITSREAIRLRNIIKEDLQNAQNDNANLGNIPVTITDIEESLSANTNLITVDDTTVTVNMFPFWERCCIDINGDPPRGISSRNFESAAEYFASRMEYLESVAGSRQIIVTETGWADAGVNENANNANPASMAKWMRDFVCLANRKGWKYFWFSAFDNSWRQVQEDNAESVEGHFGIFYESGNIKPYIRDLTIDCSEGYTDIDPNDDSLPSFVNTSTNSDNAAGTTPVPTTPTATTTTTTTASPTTLAPTLSPTTASPTNSIITPNQTTNPPTRVTTTSPTANPTRISTASPTGNPTNSINTSTPTTRPTRISTPSPTANPTRISTASPTTRPTSISTVSPTATPTRIGTQSPTVVPSNTPTDPPTDSPTDTSLEPTLSPSYAPTSSNRPSQSPTLIQTTSSSSINSSIPTIEETDVLTDSPPPEQPDSNDTPNQSLLAGQSSTVTATTGSIHAIIISALLAAVQCVMF